MLLGKANKKRTAPKLNIQNDERGTLTIFTVLVFVVLIALAGMTIDVARFEIERVRVQVAIDNAALAGASLSQSVNADTGQLYTPDEIVEEYMLKTDVYDIANHQSTTLQNSIIAREVIVDANVNVDTLFMHMFGYETMSMVTSTTAIESSPITEISLVLDISGSMSGDTKLGSLVDGAKLFTTNMLTGNDEDSVSISLVPYSTYVNVGTNLMNAIGQTPIAVPDKDYAVKDENGNDYTTAFPTVNVNTCMTYSSDAYSSVGLPDANDMTPQQTYGYSNYSATRYAQTGNSVSTPYCPSFEWAQILPIQNELSFLTAALDEFEATTNTSIDDGVMWGAALLDPSTRPAISQLTYMAEGEKQRVSPTLDGRPLDYDVGSNKILVVMTDGVNTSQYRLKDPYNSTQTANFYYNPTFFDGDDSGDKDDINGLDEYIYEDDYDDLKNGNSSERKKVQNFQELSWKEYFSLRTVYEHRSAIDDALGYFPNWSNYMEAYKQQSAKNTRLSDICSEAKTAGIKIYTITYEASVESAQIMSDCSSGAGFAYTATTVDIASVFANIGLGIQKLQLTQ